MWFTEEANGKLISVFRRKMNLVRDQRNKLHGVAEQDYVGDFNQVREILSPGAVVVFDDIRSGKTPRYM
jgi:hypothetical protein